MADDTSKADVDRLFTRLNREAIDAGYHLNPDPSFTMELVKSLLVNEKRYGYWACPCRLADGKKSQDLDIICPCDYRDEDLEEYGACYCALYVSAAVLSGERSVEPIPERRPEEKKRRQFMQQNKDAPGGTLPFPVWRCNVCGYLCARNNPPEVCPICKAKKDRFAPFF
jgi:ferredoxin-thioredoxin reductase catalytic chain